MGETNSIYISGRESLALLLSTSETVGYTVQLMLGVEPACQLLSRQVLEHSYMLASGVGKACGPVAIVLRSVHGGHGAPKF